MGGVIAIAGNEGSAQLVQVGLFSLQHRGQESCGITVYDKDSAFFNYHTGSGLVMSNFKPAILEQLKGSNAIGHVRYPTSGSKVGLEDAQPFMYKCVHGLVSIALSGNLINTESIKDKLAKKGSIFQHSSDTELIVHLLASQKMPLENALKKTLSQIEGGYAAVMLFNDKVIAFRDPLGIRPLVLGKVGNSFVVSSETPAIEVMGGKYIRDIEPAELLIIDGDKLKTSFFTKPKKEHNCIFEQVYLSRPDALMRGKAVAQARMDMGRALARQMKGVKADIVMPVPDSGMFAALGFSKESGLPFEIGLVRNHYMGRSFIKSTQILREMVAKLKLFPIENIVKNKDIILVDDSIVRGTTARQMINVLREHGARKIHFAVTSPPIVAPCFYGINTPSKEELISCTHTHKQIVKAIDVDSLTFITQENAVIACGGIGGPEGFCDSCFTDKYPTKISKATMEAR
ncbi:amidophosphoribosyltransferase [Elusimicrobium posterum]|uniref:amidophosphoribosyltransferase n=1 Tax=Elusimicrobium posterum TaxID=3116653 RepID=UPI003C70D8AE